MKGRIKTYSITLAVLVATFFSLQVKRFITGTLNEEIELTKSANEAVCTTFTKVCKLNDPKVKVSSCAGLAKGNFELVASGDPHKLKSVLSSSLISNRAIDLPIKIAITSVNNSPGQNFESVQRDQAQLHSAFVSLIIPSKFELFLNNLDEEIVLMTIITGMSFLLVFYIQQNKVQSVSIDHPQSIGRYLFDSKNHTLAIDEEVRRMTKKECQILLCLARSKNQVVKREEILLSIWGKSDYFTGRSLDVFIARLRKHLKHDDGVSIDSIHGVGFVLSEKGKTNSSN